MGKREKNDRRPKKKVRGEMGDSISTSGSLTKSGQSRGGQHLITARVLARRKRKEDHPAPNA